MVTGRPCYQANEETLLFVSRASEWGSWSYVATKAIILEFEMSVGVSFKSFAMVTVN